MITVGEKEKGEAVLADSSSLTGSSLTEPRWNLDFPRAWPALGSAWLRCEPEDFVVEELFDTTFSGSGEHLYLQLRKKNLNTHWLAEQLAAVCGVPVPAVGYAGLKDRRAVTTQWFSVPVAKPVDIAALQARLGEDEQVELLDSARHSTKLLRGQHSANRFGIRLRQLSVEPAAMEERLGVLAAEGVPNYFGEQRFGHFGNNLSSFADRLRDGRLPRHLPRRDMVLSAARSWLFNQVLAARVADGSWSLMDDQDPLSATGPLWGRGRSPLTQPGEERERRWLEPWSEWLYALEHAGLRQERRALCLRLHDWCWNWPTNDSLEITFTLPPGAFATVVIRELVVALRQNIVGGSQDGRGNQSRSQGA